MIRLSSSTGTVADLVPHHFYDGWVSYMHPYAPASTHVGAGPEAQFNKPPFSIHYDPQAKQLLVRGSIELSHPHSIRPGSTDVSRVLSLDDVDEPEEMLSFPLRNGAELLFGTQRTPDGIDVDYTRLDVPLDQLHHFVAEPERRQVELDAARAAAIRDELEEIGAVQKKTPRPPRRSRSSSAAAKKRAAARRRARDKKRKAAAKKRRTARDAKRTAEQKKAAAKRRKQRDARRKKAQATRRKARDAERKRARDAQRKKRAQVSAKKKVSTKKAAEKAAAKKKAQKAKEAAAKKKEAAEQKAQKAKEAAARKAGAAGSAAGAAGSAAGGVGGGGLGLGGLGGGGVGGGEGGGMPPPGGVPPGEPVAGVAPGGGMMPPAGEPMQAPQTQTIVVTQPQPTTVVYLPVSTVPQQKVETLPQPAKPVFLAPGARPMVSGQQEIELPEAAQAAGDITLSAAAAAAQIGGCRHSTYTQHRVRVALPTLYRSADDHWQAGPYPDIQAGTRYDSESDCSSDDSDCSSVSDTYYGEHSSGSEDSSSGSSDSSGSDMSSETRAAIVQHAYSRCHPAQRGALTRVIERLQNTHMAHSMSAHLHELGNFLRPL